jgi:hypothetical protein
MKKILITIALIAAPALALADDARYAETFSCELKDGKKMEEVMANNKRWLANARQAAGTDEINSYSLTPVVGDLSRFVFIDSFPSMAAWAAYKSAEESEESKAIEATFNDLMDCSKNRLYKSTKT